MRREFYFNEMKRSDKYRITNYLSLADIKLDGDSFDPIYECFRNGSQKCSLCFSFFSINNVFVYWNSGRKGVSPQRVALPPPVYGAASLNSSKSFSNSKPTWSSSYEPSVPSFSVNRNPTPTSTAPPVASSTYDNQVG